MSSNTRFQRILLISPKELKWRLDKEKPLTLFDIRKKDRYNREHIPGSWFIDQKHKNMIKNLFAKLPKDIDIILVGEDDNDDGSHFRQTITAMLENSVELRMK